MEAFLFICGDLVKAAVKSGVSRDSSGKGEDGKFYGKI
jgi:hypothetical protein